MPLKNVEKKNCRLCDENTSNITDIFNEEGIKFDLTGKIAKYLDLHIDSADGLSRIICPSCMRNLKDFHHFYTKVNNVQKNILKEKYYELRLSPNLCLAQDNPNDTDASVAVVKVVVISDNNEINRSEVIEEYEEYEIVEIDNVEEVNSTIDNSIENEAEISDVITTSPIRIQTEYIDQPKLRRSARRQAKPEKNEIPNSKSVASHINCIKNNQKDKFISKKKRKTVNTNAAEGESSDEFPTDESETDDFSKQISNDFPKEIIKNGTLMFRGKKLMSLINKFYSLECEQCDKKTKFTELKELFEHYSEKHEEKGFVTCCQTKLIRYPVIVMHMARHLQPEAFKCDECGYVVTRPRFLESHKQTHLPETEKPFACNECPKRFSWKGALKVHLISHQPVNERPRYICHICGKSYDYPGGLSTHKKYVHSKTQNAETNICHICAKNFATRTGLREHMATIHQPREMGQVQCNECGKWLMNKRCLRTHMILHSNQEFKCDHCEYLTKKKVLLNRHVISQHTNDKPFKCNMCDRTFKMKRALTIHLALHGASKTFKCTFCDRVYRSSTNCYMHRKSKHPVELEEWNRKKEEEKRLKRINAGIEDALSEEENSLNDC